MTELEKLIERVNKFTNDRDWKQFHTPENLSKSIMLEGAELLENFQWSSEGSNMQNIQEEIADVFAYLLMIASHYDFDIVDITNQKFDLNELKYPIGKSFGKSDKYNKL